MDNLENEFKKNKIADIHAISFSEKPQEVLATMEIVLTMYQFDDDWEIIEACKIKLSEGIEKLKILGQYNSIRNFEVDK